MNSLRHDFRNGPTAGPLAAAASIPDVGQPPVSSPGRSTPATSRRAGGLPVATGAEGFLMTMKVRGDLTEADTRRLATMLIAVAWSDGERATIGLADFSSVGSELLRVLRTARTRSQGRLTVTADRPRSKRA